ncbi:MAG: pilus assembly protein [Chloroflexi bacterium]|nr:pilus assembly protein [Chloroflexota bacterium]MBU1751938.1 pilus assembly protein [Chloroflexota bacterium]MBU1879849.1 pilus assembly protein [Chloroflexota bacterium]
MQRWADGQSMVEFALLLPLVILLAMGIFAFALIFNAQITVANAAAAAARAGSVVNYSDYHVSGHENQNIYDAVVTNMSWLGMGRIQSITVYQPTSTGGVSSRNDQLNPANGSLSGGNYTNAYRLTNSSLGVEIVYHEPVWIPIINLITGDHIEIRVRESRRIE